MSDYAQMKTSANMDHPPIAKQEPKLRYTTDYHVVYYETPRSNLSSANTLPKHMRANPSIVSMILYCNTIFMDKHVTQEMINQCKTLFDLDNEILQTTGKRYCEWSSPDGIAFVRNTETYGIREHLKDNNKIPTVFSYRETVGTSTI
jgi:hypothetical protein